MFSGQSLKANTSLIWFHDKIKDITIRFRGYGFWQLVKHRNADAQLHQLEKKA